MLIPERENDETVALKSFCTFEIKDAAKGEVEAIIATLGVVDKDEDIIRGDAIPEGAKVSMSAYGHDAVFGARPVGKGKLFVEGKKLVFKGRVFLATTDGRDTFEVLKEMGGDQEWSFGFRILGAEVPSDEEKKLGARRILTKLDCFEVSPVIVGAGVGTRTTAVKAAQAEPDPAIEAARIAAEQAETARVAELKRQHAINEGADRLFRRPPAGVTR
jgi:phage head maturation protease